MVGREKQGETQLALAFVDETGDPGTGGAGRPWFCWVAFVVLNDYYSAMKSMRNFLAGALPQKAGNPAHWSAADFTVDDLIGTLRYIRDMPGWYWVAVASNTPLSTAATAGKIHDPTEHRYYTMLVMLERLSWLGDAVGEPVLTWVEKPNDSGFTQSYLRVRHEAGLPGRWANYDFLPPGNIFLAAKANQPLLCFADTLACAAGKAVNPHERRSQTIPGEVFPEYLQLVWDRVWSGPWRGRRALTDTGFTILPYAFRPHLSAQLLFLPAWLQQLGLVR